MALPLVMIKGGGDLASGVAHRLHQSGFPILIIELPHPLVVRRTVAFATAMQAGSIEVEGVTARRIESRSQSETVLERGEIAVLADSSSESVGVFKPVCLVDAIMAKANRGTRIGDAPVVIALGPGFVAGEDAHAVVETNRGHNLGRVYYSGSAESDTGEPATVQGLRHERVLRAPVTGCFDPIVDIGTRVAPGVVVGAVAGVEILARIQGVVRGLIAAGTLVPAGLKFGDIDPSGDPSHCFTISDKSRAIGGGVLEALMHLTRRLPGSA
jgi:xanthine dehydrogenase accessory factor